MLNDIRVYFDAGYKAGNASRKHDAGLARHWREWKQRAVAMEAPQDRALAETDYNRVYAEAQSGRF